MHQPLLLIGLPWWEAKTDVHGIIECRKTIPHSAPLFDAAECPRGSLSKGGFIKKGRRWTSKDNKILSKSRGGTDEQGRKSKGIVGKCSVGNAPGET